MDSPTRPASRDEFRIAIICALSREADAVILLFDQQWDESYGRAEGDRNSYTTGRIGHHDVVLAYLPDMGTQNAAAAAASMRSSYCGLKVAFLVGICGAVPKIGDAHVMLGDVIISDRIVQYDYGKQYPGHFETRPTLAGPDMDLRGLLSALNTHHAILKLQKKARNHLDQLQRAATSSDPGSGRHHRADYSYPGMSKDKLFQAGYTHKHDRNCDECRRGFCESASTTSCSKLGCHRSKLVARKLPHTNSRNYQSEIFIGRVGSANTVMKSAKDRDQIAEALGLIAFEMEGAGILHQLPCIVIKGVCDYADSHKNKRWQDFAAATAASVMKAVLQRYEHNDNPTGLKSTPLTLCHTIPYTQNRQVIKRQGVEQRLKALLPQTSSYSEAALWGLGGSGKTQIALEYAYRQWQSENTFVFWVNADTEATLMQDFKSIARKLRLSGALKSEQLLEAVCDRMESLPRWSLIIDNADDIDLFKRQKYTKGKCLQQYIPHSARESATVVWTSRDERIVGALVELGCGIEINGMTSSEARALLQLTTEKPMIEGDAQADADTLKLFNELQWLALSISQAGTFMKRTWTTVGEYLALLSDDNHRWELLQSSEAESYQSRIGPGVPSSVPGTWRISIERIRQDNPLAYHILHVLSYLDNKNISHDIMEEAAKYYNRGAARDRISQASYPGQQFVMDDNRRRSQNLDVMEAISRLKQYSFVRLEENQGEKSYEIHKIIQDAARYGLHMRSLARSQNSTGHQRDHKKADNEVYFSRIALQVIDSLYPRKKDKNQAEKYLAHAMRIIDWADVCGMPDCTESLIERVRHYISGRAVYSGAIVLRLAEKTFEFRQKTLGTQHEDTLSSMFDVATAYYDLRNYKAAESLADQLYVLDRRVFSEMAPETTQTLVLKADATFKSGRRDEAEKILSQASDRFTRAGKRNDTFAKVMYHRAWMRKGQEDHDAAFDLALSAMDSFQQYKPTKYSIWCMQLVAEIYIYRMDYHDAIMILEPALKDSEKVPGMARTRHDLVFFLAFSHFYMAEYDEAETVASKAVNEGKRMFGAADSRTLQAQTLLDKIQISIRDIDEESIRRKRKSLSLALRAISRLRTRISRRNSLSLISNETDGSYRF
ncbi:unnamed protein product [Clonostachys rosea]|uniref:Nucleoside phosphorylase domain-containing protein n=1 Tax=Bionectria ochroleuca TaxID=29856 RepID=A0ABY6V2Q9_BIOOC|nr:unnamed protein product [Clonostachys rosea]